MNNFVRPKKHLGQHFLKDENIARKIVGSLQLVLSPPKADEGSAACPESAEGGQRIGSLLEIGPGMGVLTKYLLDLPGIDCYFIDTDREAIDYLNNAFPGHEARFIHGDYLRMNTVKIFTGPYAVIGNFPYNISSQIFFRILEERRNVTEVVGMVQKEVAERLAAGPGSKTYGILSVLLQAYYRIEYLFTVNENVFVPPPRVKSAVIRLTRNDTERLDCDEELFFRVVKTAFNQRRKTLRNSLKSFYIDYERGEILHLAGKRAEQLSVEDFVKLTRVAV